MKTWIITIIATLSLTGLLYLAGFAAGQPTFGVLESIHGIPYPHTDSGTVVTEQLAHADIYLNQPALAQQATITIDFDPGNIDSLSVGIRENEFWLSYPRHTIYNRAVDSTGRIQKTITIPLTDKLQDSDQSLDLMLFATPPNAATIDNIDAGIDDSTTWYLHDLTITTNPTWPTPPQLKDYARSLLTRERPL